MLVSDFLSQTLSPVLGAEIIGLDVSRSLNEKTFERIRKLFLKHLVLVLRDQHLSPQEQIAFGRRFGPLKGHVLTHYLHKGHPELLVVSNKRVDGEPVGIEDAGRYWHSDVSYEPEPPMASILYALEVPLAGGDTMFANSYLAYDALPAALKERIATLKAHHRFNYVKIQRQGGSTRAPLSAEQKSRLTGAVHPIVRTHPETGRKALYVSPGFTESIDGLDREDSDGLLNRLFAYATNDEVIYRHRWKPFDLVIWDNRCTMHHATEFDSKYTRHMLRATIAGDRPTQE